MIVEHPLASAEANIRRIQKSSLAPDRFNPILQQIRHSMKKIGALPRPMVVVFVASIMQVVNNLEKEILNEQQGNGGTPVEKPSADVGEGSVAGETSQQ